MVRDAQRQRVYHAQVDVLRGREWQTIPEIQAYIDRLLASAVWPRLCPSVTRVIIKPAQWNALSSRAYPDPDRTGGTIRLHPEHYCQLILFHELAHLAQPPDTAWHGPEFCLIYLRLVYHLLGDRIGDALDERFKSHRVQVAPSAVPLRRICLNLHGIARQPAGLRCGRRRPVQGRGAPDLSLPGRRRRASRPRVRGTAAPPPSVRQDPRETPAWQPPDGSGHAIGGVPTGARIRVRAGRRVQPRVEWDLHTLEVFGRPGGVRLRVRGGGGDDAGQMSLEALLAAYGL
jgi:hypothetical protein